jgi:hypothetical protein
MRIHFAAEHAPQLKAAHLALKAAGVLLDIARGGLILFALGELKNFGSVGDVLRHPVEFLDLPD